LRAGRELRDLRIGSRAARGSLEDEARLAARVVEPAERELLRVGDHGRGKDGERDERGQEDRARRAEPRLHTMDPRHALQEPQVKFPTATHSHPYGAATI
jgi:hypothetical protein